MLHSTNDQRRSLRPNLKDEEGFRRLAQAILVRAIDDGAGETSQTADSAIRWLAGHATGGLTFERCCALLGITPHVVRSSLRRYHEPIRLRFERYNELR